MAKLLEQAFQIRPEERRIVLLFFAFFAGVGMFYTVGATVGDTLFLSNLPVGEVPRKLPLVYIGVAVANVLSTLAFGAVQSRVSRTASIIGTQVVLALSLLLARKLVENGSSSLYFGLVIWLEACSLLSITLFFSFAGDYFSPRDARRLYGFIAGGMSFGTVVSGYAIGTGVSLIGTKNLLYVSALLLLCNAGLAAHIYRVATPLAADAAEEDANADQFALRTLFARPYVRLLALMIPLSIITYVTVDYQMKWIASAKAEEALARFFGNFFSWVGIAQIVFQFVLAQRLLNRLGILSSLMILPIAVGSASALLYASSAFDYFGLGILAFSASVNFLRMTLSETLDLPSRELLYLPLPTRLRIRLQPLLSGAFAPGAQGLGALLMLAALQLHVRVESLSLVATTCATALLLTLARLRPKYRETLAATLRDHQLDATDLAKILQSPSAQELLESLLRSTDTEVVKATIGLLAGRDLGALGPGLEELVASSDDEVAIAALQRLAAEKDARFMGAIQRAWTSPQLPVRQAAVLALCETSGQQAMLQVASTLDSTDSQLRGSAIIGLARHCGPAGRSMVRPGLAASAHSSDPRERAEAARMLGRIRSEGFADLIEPLLCDPVREVRQCAAEACAGIRDAALCEPLLAATSDPDLHAAALRALATLPEGAVGPIARLVRVRELALSERCAMASVLGRIAGTAAAETLWVHADAAQEISLRLACAEALRGMRSRDAWPPIELIGYEARVDALCERIQLLSRAIAEIGDGDAFASGIFGDHARMHIELLCAILALRHDAKAIDRVRYNLFNEPREIALRVFELIEEVLPRRLSQPAVAALQSWLDRSTAGAGLSNATRDRLIEAEPWLRVATLHHVNQGAAYPTIEAGRLSDHDRELYRLLDVVSFLKRVPLLCDLSAYYLLEQAEIAEWYALAAGGTLFRQGDEGDALYIICQGELEVRIGDRVVANVGAGECVGELALLDGEPRSAGAVARTDATLLKIAASRFKHLLVTQPAAARALLRTLDKRIRETQASPTPELTSGPRMRRSQLMRAQKLGLQQLVSTMSFLRQVELFKDLPTPSLANLAGIAQEVTVYEGDSLFEEGDSGESLYLVCSGQIEVSVNQRRLTVLERNACLGEMALLGGLPRSATATALSEGRLLRIGSDDFMNLLSHEAEITIALLRTLSKRLREALEARQAPR
jgi:CRP-like cAMP-binding protein/HEAT repeat protein